MATKSTGAMFIDFSNAKIQAEKCGAGAFNILPIVKKIKDRVDLHSIELVGSYTTRTKNQDDIMSKVLQFTSEMESNGIRTTMIGRSQLTGREQHVDTTLAMKMAKYILENKDRYQTHTIYLVSGDRDFYPVCQTILKLTSWKICIISYRDSLSSDFAKMKSGTSSDRTAILFLDNVEKKVVSTDLS